MILDASMEEARADQFVASHLYVDQSCITVFPTRGTIPARVYDSHMTIARLPNQRFNMLTVANMEVSAAYEWAITNILSDTSQSWRWMLTLEEDNIVPADAIIKLTQAAHAGGYDVLGGLYWVKGEGGVPQIWGDASDPKENYRPQPPDPAGGVVPCYGTGMGCTLFSIDFLRKVEVPRFLVPPEDGTWTQDLRFFNRAYSQGLKPKVGVHCGVKVGHLDVASGVVW